MHKLLTREQAREALNERGVTIAEFCRVHGLNRQMVSDLLGGRKKGLRGEAHRAAVLLGLKKGVIIDHTARTTRLQSPPKRRVPERRVSQDVRGTSVIEDDETFAALKAAVINPRQKFNEPLTGFMVIPIGAGPEYTKRENRELLASPIILTTMRHEPR